MSNIANFLSKDAIACNLACPDWKSAVREAGRLLVKEEIVEEAFIGKMIGYVEEFGPYIVILPGFALAHARPEDGALKTGISLITLTPPVHFGHEDNDPVSIVVALASSEKGEHLECLGDVVGLISQKEKAEKILAAITPEEIYRLLI